MSFYAEIHAMRAEVERLRKIVEELERLRDAGAFKTAAGWPQGRFGVLLALLEEKP